MLSTLAKTDYLCYPLSLTKRERPDFLLTCNEKEIGIEVTEATSADYSAFQALIEHKNPNHFIEPAYFRHGKEVNKDKLLNAKKLKSTGWNGDEPEKEWSLFIQDAIAKKLKKLQDPSFSKFNQNWLLIYDNCPAMFLNKDLLMPYIENLFPHPTPHHIETSWFDTIFVENEEQLLVVSHNSNKYFNIK